MATIHYEGLDGWQKSAALWGAAGIFLALAKSPPLPWMIIAILCGSITGGVCAYLLSQMKLRAISTADWIGLLAFGAVIYLMFISTPRVRLSPLGALGLGCLFTSMKSLVFGIAGTRAMKAVNEKNASWLGKLDPAPKRVGPPPSSPSPLDAPVDLDASKTRLLANLPEPLRSEIAGAFQTITLATPFRSLQSIPAAASSLSGAALLDPAHAWPHRDGQPLDFLAQLNLEEIPETGHARPPRGLISFFYDAANSPWGSEAGDRSGTVVLFSPDPASARPILKPGTPPHAPPRKPLAFTRVAAFCPTRAQEERLEDFIQQSDAAIAEVVSDAQMTLSEANPPEDHRVLSAPALVQEDMDDDLANAAGFLGLPSSTKWTLLLQLDSDRDLGWCWGDAGCLYFWIPEEDLAAGRFDQVWTILQCC
ncbi:YwqG family protein [Luteolibacter flavescens]|uniref:YwqG family protein n=1 Tax=Luteolibacter flavescens TaxID=1859460 RepID=A0ABT3FLY4_9BACT|nr:YwqG family protein [Luteolibacter flavescens]MCW1884582.1 YwqG family protein [Luteolibacter flavescens]